MKDLATVTGENKKQNKAWISTSSLLLLKNKTAITCHLLLFSCLSQYSESELKNVSSFWHAIQCWRLCLPALMVTIMTLCGVIHSFRPGVSKLWDLKVLPSLYVYPMTQADCFLVWDWKRDPQIADWINTLQRGQRRVLAPQHRYSLN